MTRPPVTLDERRCFTEAQKAQIWRRAKGRCELCGKRVKGKWIAGHIQQWALGGPTTVENGRVEGVDCGCAAVTQAKDTNIAAKTERMAGRRGQYARRKRNGPKLKSAKKKWPSRAFDKRYRQKINGTVEKKNV